MFKSERSSVWTSRTFGTFLFQSGMFAVFTSTVFIFTFYFSFLFQQLGKVDVDAVVTFKVKNLTFCSLISMYFIFCGLGFLGCLHIEPHFGLAF